MSFGFSISDAITITQLAWKTIQNSRKACGEHDDFTREVSSLHLVLQRLQQEIEKPESPLNRPSDKVRNYSPLSMVARGSSRGSIQF